MIIIGNLSFQQQLETALRYDPPACIQRTLHGVHVSWQKNLSHSIFVFARKLNALFEALFRKKLVRHRHQNTRTVARVNFGTCAASMD